VKKKNYKNKIDKDNSSKKNDKDNKNIFKNATKNYKILVVWFYW